MRKVGEVTDNWGSWLRIDTRPGDDLDDPVFFVVTVKDEAISAVTLNYEQALELSDVLLEALDENY